MKRPRKPSLGTVLGGLALFVAGTGTATAAGSLVTIQDGATSATAKVATDGRLLVGDGSGPLDVAGSVQAQRAAPVNFFRQAAESFGTTCIPVYAPPSGKAAILTDVTSTTYSGGRAGLSWRLFVSPTSSTYPCNSGFLEILSTVETQVQNFGTGVAIPAGSGVYLNQYNFDNGGVARGVVAAAGYLVAASAVPSSAGAGVPDGPAGSATGGAAG